MRAVVFIDCQNDFVTGALRNEKAIEVMPKIVEFARECAGRGDVVYATRDTHLPNYLDTLEGRKLPVKHCIVGTDGWQIVDELEEVLPSNTLYVNKETFGSEDLVSLFAELYPDEIVLCGFVTSICVLANAVMLRAALPNTKITVIENLCAGVTEEDHAAALKVLAMQQIEVVTDQRFAQRDIIHVEAGVRYAEDATVNERDDDEENPAMPFLDKKGDEWLWKLDIDAKTGEVIGWKEKYPSITTARSFYKVCDCCHIRYGKLDYDEYVPKFLSLDDTGYGDYMYITVENGYIKKWNERLFREFVNEVAKRN